jgi:tRNA(Ile)-lysidine synthetase-like protein
MIKYNKQIVNRSSSFIDNNDQYVLMCSSGVDSIAGVHYILPKIKKTDILNFMVVHYNHKIRPQNDLMQYSFMQFMHKELPSFPSFCLNREEDGVELHTEAQFRETRYNHLMKMFHKQVFITFHHLNDCVESYLLNCIRGHDGYQPIPFWTICENRTKNVICHPFLFTKKKDFVDYAQKHDLMKYVVEDETNTVSKGSRRNMIRNEIIPILERDKVGLETVIKKKMEKRLMLELLK